MLPQGEYAAFKVLARGAEREDIIRFMTIRDDYDPEDVRAILRVSIAANERIFQELEKEGVMVGAFERVFHEELTAARDNGITIGRNEGISIGEERARRSIMDRLIAGGISPQQAAAFTGMNV